MCGNGGNRAASQARQSEGIRQLQVSRSTAAIDQAFAGREGQLAEFVAALRENFRVDAFRQKDIADRSLKFSLARGGLTGGSVAKDTGVTLGREFQEGLVKGERQAQGAVAELRSADEASKRGLIALAQSGAGVSTAAEQAATAMRANIESARTTGLAADIGDIFTDTRKLYVQQQEAAARRKGLAESELFAEPFSRGG